MDIFARSGNPDRFASGKVGMYLIGLSTIAAGILDLIWGNFDVGHQPIDALGIHIPGRAVLAYLTGIWLILGGAAILWRRTARAGTLATALIYCIFGMFSLPRFYTMPHKFGFHITLILGVLGEELQQLIVVAGLLVLYESFATHGSGLTGKKQLAARLVFGLSGVLFGFSHMINPKGPVHMIPPWMPFGGPFWILISGIGFGLAGIGILTGILNVLAARLLALMLFVFEIVLVPIIFGYPHLHQAWGATTYNLAVAGAVLIFAASIPSRRAQEVDLVEAASDVA